MTRQLYVVLLFVTCVTYYMEAAKILCVLQVPCLSHQIAFRSLTEELLRRNHEIDVITVDPMYPKGQTPPNMTEIDIHNLSYNVWKQKSIELDKAYSIASQLKHAMNLIIDVTKVQFASKEFQDLIKSGKSYDLIIGNPGFPPILVYPYIFKAPLIAVSTAGIITTVFDYMGIPRHVLYYPNYVRNIPKNSLYEKYKAIYDNAIRVSIEEDWVHKLDEVIRSDFYPDLPDLNVLRSNVHVCMSNMYLLWAGIRPYPPSSGVFKFVTQVGRQIPKNIQTYLDTSSEGVIYASFGTSVSFSSLPEGSIESILRAFSALPYDVLLKCDKDELPNKPNNVKLFKFLPQPDVLRHPKIKLFITQGGQHSIDEAIETGVPLIVMPSRFDQFTNSEKCVHYGIGITLDAKTITEQELIDAIKNVIGDKKYRDNIAKLRSILQDSPITSMDRLIWAIEYMIRHGGAKHLRSPAANMSWAEFFEFELILYLLLIIVTILLIIIKLILTLKRVIVKMIRKRNGATKFD